MLVAVQKGDARELAQLMRRDPSFDVNIVLDEDGWTLLYYACMNNDSRSPVIPLLLAHPDIDVNVKNSSGNTPFFLCLYL